MAPFHHAHRALQICGLKINVLWFVFQIYWVSQVSWKSVSYFLKERFPEIKYWFWFFFFDLALTELSKNFQALGSNTDSSLERLFKWLLTPFPSYHKSYFGSLLLLSSLLFFILTWGHFHWYYEKARAHVSWTDSFSRAQGAQVKSSRVQNSLPRILKNVLLIKAFT